MTADHDAEKEREAMYPDALQSIGSAGGANAVKTALKNAAEATGVGFDMLYRMAQRESSLDPAARAKTSSAAGLFQFIDQTWLGAVKKYGAKHGMEDAAAAITQDSKGRYVVVDAEKRQEILNHRFDPMKAAALAGELIQENRANLEMRLGRAVNSAEIYAAHFLGAGGAAKLLKAAPETAAAEILPRAAAANRPVFYDGARAKTIAEVMESIRQSMGAQSDEVKTASAPPLETKSASLRENLFAAAQTARLPAPVEAPQAPVMRDEPAASAPRAYALLSEVEGRSISPLSLTVLSALDATRIGESRDEVRKSLR